MQVFDATRKWHIKLNMDQCKSFYISKERQENDRTTSSGSIVRFWIISRGRYSCSWVIVDKQILCYEMMVVVATNPPGLKS